MHRASRTVAGRRLTRPETADLLLQLPAVAALAFDPPEP